MLTSSRPHTELRRVTVCEHDERLEVKSVRGIGFASRCTCGWRGPVRWQRAVAVHDKHEHEATHDPPLLLVGGVPFAPPADAAPSHHTR